MFEIANHLTNQLIHLVVNVNLQIWKSKTSTIQVSPKKGIVNIRRHIYPKRSFPVLANLNWNYTRISSNCVKIF